MKKTNYSTALTESKLCILLQLEKNKNWMSPASILSTDGTLKKGSIHAQLTDLLKEGYINVRLSGTYKILTFESYEKIGSNRDEKGKYIEREFCITQKGLREILKIRQMFYIQKRVIK